MPPYPPPCLVIITGLPCSGKTVLAERIAVQVRLPLITKDGIKERLFDSLGWSDRAWSKKLGGATYELLFYFMEQLLAAGQSLIVESNFYPAFHLERFLAIQQRAPYRALQIQCVAEGEVLVRRFRQRWERGERHPGHVDPETYTELDATLRKGKQPPLEVGGAYLEVDTNDFALIDYERIFRFLSEIFPHS